MFIRFLYESCSVLRSNCTNVLFYVFILKFAWVLESYCTVSPDKGVFSPQNSKFNVYIFCTYVSMHLSMYDLPILMFSLTK